MKIMCLRAWRVRFERPRTTPGPGKSPTAVSGVPKRAVLSATTRSQTIVSSQPPPRAWPCTAAIVGFEISSTARKERERLLDVGATVTGAAELAEALDVAADGEALPGPVEDDDADAGSSSASVTRRLELGEEVAGHRVQLLRPVERQPGDRCRAPRSEIIGRPYTPVAPFSTKQLVGKATARPHEKGEAAGRSPRPPPANRFVALLSGRTPMRSCDRASTGVRAFLPHRDAPWPFP